MPHFGVKFNEAAARAKAFTFSQIVVRIFCGFAAKNRAIKATGGCQGYGFASGHGAVRRGRFTPLLSLARAKIRIHADFRLPKNGLRAVFELLSFYFAKTHTLETFGIHAGTAFRPSGGFRTHGESKCRCPELPPAGIFRRRGMCYGVTCGSRSAASPPRPGRRRTRAFMDLRGPGLFFAP
jgi:hypothetical protein